MLINFVNKNLLNNLKLLVKPTIFFFFLIFFQNSNFKYLHANTHMLKYIRFVCNMCKVYYYTTTHAFWRSPRYFIILFKALLPTIVKRN